MRRDGPRHMWEASGNFASLTDWQKVAEGMRKA